MKRKASKKKPVGRPPAKNPANAALPRVRITQDALEGYKTAADMLGMSVSEWIRSALDAEQARADDILESKTNSTVIRLGIDDLNVIEEVFGLPKGFIDSLKNEDDWALILKSHALLESACANMLTHYFGKPELEDFFAWIDMSDKKRGKAAIISALKLLDKPERAFISTLSELRNVMAHNASNVCFSVTDYLSGLNSAKRSGFVKSLNIRVNSMEFNGKKYSGEELVMHLPQLVIWNSVLTCLSKIFIESVFAIERNKLIKERVSDTTKYGPKKVDPKKISLAVGP